MLKKSQEKLKTLITEAKTINTYNKDYSNQKHTTHTQTYGTRMDEWSMEKKFSQTEHYTYMKVRGQTDGDVLAHLIVNGVAIR